MFSRILPQNLFRSWLLQSRGLVTSELNTKNDYVLRMEVEPFAYKDLELCQDNDKLYLHGYREEQTGINNWKHSLDLVLTLPPSVRRDTLEACYNQGILEIKGLNKNTTKEPAKASPPVADCPSPS